MSVCFQRNSVAVTSTTSKELSPNAISGGVAYGVLNLTTPCSSKTFARTEPDCSSGLGTFRRAVQIVKGRPAPRAVVVSAPAGVTDVLTRLTVQLRRRSDASVIWEGRAESIAHDGTPAAQPPAAVQRLAAAMFQGFPGRSGEIITVK